MVQPTNAIPKASATAHSADLMQFPPAHGSLADRAHRELATEGIVPITDADPRRTCGASREHRLDSCTGSSEHQLRYMGSMLPDTLNNPTVKAAIDAFQRADRKAWSSLFEAGAELFDDGSPRSLEKFTREALGHERFTSFDRVSADGLEVTGSFHSEQWGDFRTYFRFQLGRGGKIHRLDIGQVE